MKIFDRPSDPSRFILIDAKKTILIRKMLYITKTAASAAAVTQNQKRGMVLRETIRPIRAFCAMTDGI
jgi:hypothetical protein